jgi:hypothetical protein
MCVNACVHVLRVDDKRCSVWFHSIRSVVLPFLSSVCVVKSARGVSA